MPLPPIKISDAVQKAAYDDLAKGAMRKFGDAVTIIAERLLHPHMKSTEELALDWVAGEQEGENRRRLAAEALDRIPEARRIFPAPQIAGPIFRDSEFELPGTPIWELWSQLLSRACDSERVREAHPSYPWFISQMTSLEAIFLDRMTKEQDLSSLASIMFPEETGVREIDLATKLFNSTPEPFSVIFNLRRIGLVYATPIAKTDKVDKSTRSDTEIRLLRLTLVGESFMAALDPNPKVSDIDV